MNKKIKKFLEENNITVKELAEKSKINVRCLYDIFNANRKISAEEYIAICYALNVKMEYFIEKNEIA